MVGSPSRIVSSSGRWIRDWGAGEMKVIRVVLLLMLLLTPVSAHASPSEPLVFLPGILGSKLYRGDQVLWGDRSSYLRFDQLRLKEGDGIEARGLIESIRVLGPFRIKQYTSLIDHLEDLGYERGETLFLYPYDWRKSNFITAQELQAFIDATPELSIGSFNILAHSMGGLVARILIDRHPAGRRVGRYITMGTPYRGSLYALESFVEGFSGLARFLSGDQETVREVMFSFESGYELLPDPDWNVCCYAGSSWEERQQIDIHDLQHWRDWWAPPSFRTPEGLSFIQKGLGRRAELHAIVSKPINARVGYHATIATGLVPTKAKVQFNKTGDVSLWKYYPGDGTVDLQSATLNAPYKSRVSLTKHAAIFDNKAVRETLQRILITHDDIYEFAGSAPCSNDADQQCVRIEGTEVSGVLLTVEPSLVRAGENVQIEVDFTVEQGSFPPSFVPTAGVGAQGGIAVGIPLRRADDSMSRYLGEVRLWDEAEYVVQLKTPEFHGLEEYVLLLAEKK